MWAITDPQNGQSAYPKPENYEAPLPKAYDAANHQRYVRLSRLWSKAQANPGLKEAQFRTLIKEHLIQQMLSEEQMRGLLQPLGELMTTLRDVKLSDVTFLELQPYHEQTWTSRLVQLRHRQHLHATQYRRRTLTREEITLAWLKVGWTRSTPRERPPENASMTLEKTSLATASTSKQTSSSARHHSSGPSHITMGDYWRTVTCLRQRHPSNGVGAERPMATHYRHLRGSEQNTSTSEQSSTGAGDNSRPSTPSPLFGPGYTSRKAGKEITALVNSPVTILRNGAATRSTNTSTSG